MHLAGAELGVEQLGREEGRPKFIDLVIDFHSIVSSRYRRFTVSLRVSGINIRFIQSTRLFVPTLLTGLDVSGNAEKHVFTKLSHVDGLVALIDDIRVAFPSLVRVSHGFMAHPCVKLLSTLLGGGLF